MIHFNNISLTYSSGIVFKDFFFDIEEKSRVCITGPSGSGKSTILKMIQGYVVPEAGFIKVGENILGKDTVKTIRSRMAYVPQNINLPVSNGLDLMKMLAVKRKRHVAESFVEQFGLNPGMIHRPFDEMSGGQKQRIVIAICLALDRDILLLDEPTSSLDEASINRLRDVIIHLEGKTVVTASHHQGWIDAMDKEIKLTAVS